MEPYDLTNLFFCKVGSCFNQLQNSMTKIRTITKTSDLPLCFKESTIRNVFNQIQDKFLSPDLLQFLDNLCSDIFTGDEKAFPYKSFSEILHLVLISLLREMLSQQVLAPVFINEIQVYMKKVNSKGRVHRKNCGFFFLFFLTAS